MGKDRTELLKIAVCDDEAVFQDRFCERLGTFFRQEKIEAGILRFLSGRELLASAEKLDVVFLDIRMTPPDGFETAQKLRSRGFRGFLIFLTVLPEFVWNAFEVGAFDYLLKPLQEDRFVRTMRRLLSAIRDPDENRLLIRRGNDRLLLPYAQIAYCESIGRKIYLHLQDGAVLDYYDRMESLEKKLDARFFRCHRSYLVNLSCLKGYRTGEASLTTGAAIPVSRLREKDFLAAVSDAMKRRRDDG